MFARTADGLLTFFRAEVSDAVAPYLWQDWEAYGYMTEAFDALLKQANIVYKTIDLPFTSGVPTVPLSPAILYIRSAHVVGGVDLTPMSSTVGEYTQYTDYDMRTPPSTALFASSGPPLQYVRDYENRALRLVPIPNLNGIIELQCTVTLSIALQSGFPLPTVDATDLRLALHYMKHLAYSKHDAETEDLVRSKMHYEQFEAGVEDRKNRLENYRRAPGVVRMSGWS